MDVTFVRVPKAAFTKYWPLPWSDVVAAAERGVDDLIIPPVRRVEGGYTVIDEVAPKNTAYLREGDKSWTPNKTLLFQQNW